MDGSPLFPSGNKHGERVPDANLLLETACFILNARAGDLCFNPLRQSKVIVEIDTCIATALSLMYRVDDTWRKIHNGV